MSALQYLFVLLALVFAAGLTFFGLRERHRRIHDEDMDSQSSMLLAVCLICGVFGVVTAIQIADIFHLSMEDRVDRLGMR